MIAYQGYVLDEQVRERSGTACTAARATSHTGWDFACIFILNSSAMSRRWMKAQRSQSRHVSSSSLSQSLQSIELKPPPHQIPAEVARKRHLAEFILQLA